MTRAEMAYTVAAASANVLGAIAVVWRRRWSVKALETILAFAAGFMLSVAITEILPEAIAADPAVAALAVLAGYVLVHLTQHALVSHFHFGEETHAVNHAVSTSALAGMLLHTFVDGVAIASGFRVGHAVGVLVFTAILLHKLPEGLAITSLFLAAGATRRRALAAAGFLGLATIAGGVLTDRLDVLRAHGLALSAGVMLYVGASNLVPEFQGKPGWRLQASFFTGVGVFLAARAVTRL